jgi:hypothetical protein
MRPANGPGEHRQLGGQENRALRVRSKATFLAQHHDHTRSVLLTNSELADDIEITLRINLAKVIQMAPTATYHRQKTTPTGIVFLVRSHVLGQVIDPGCQDGNLHFR